MSDIPRARGILNWAINEELDLEATRKAIRRALRHMTRKSPEFRALDDSERMTPAKRRSARKLRQQGWAIRKIAEVLHTNGGRVSEAVRRDG